MEYRVWDFWRRRCLAGKEPRVCYCTAVKTAYLRRRRVVEMRFGRRAWLDLCCKNTVTIEARVAGADEISQRAILGRCVQRERQRGVFSADKRRRNSRSSALFKLLPTTGSESHSRVAVHECRAICGSAADDVVGLGESSVAGIRELAAQQRAGQAWGLRRSTFSQRGPAGLIFACARGNPWVIVHCLVQVYVFLQQAWLARFS
jgi:hypothetical protein